MTIRVFAVLLVLACVGLLAGGCVSEDAPDAGGGTAEATRLLEAGLELHAEGDLDGAREQYLAALAADPTYALAHYNLGVLAQEQDDPVAAEQQYRLALVDDPSLVSALFNLAILRTEAGAPEEAVMLYRRVTTVDPDNAAAHLNLGLVLLDQGRTADGQAAIDRALELDPALADRVPAENAVAPAPEAT
jgi:Tfp pilus assembly protein PilF